MKFPLILTVLLTLGTFAPAQNSPGKLSPKAPVKPGLVPEPAAVPDAEKPATEAGDASMPDKTVARFFAYLQRKEVDQAYEQLTKGTKIADRGDDVKLLKTKTKEAIAVFGAMSGYDLVGKKTVGERLVCHTYISLGKDFPLRWRFYFYKPQETWKLIDLRVDDRLASIFEEPEDPRTRD